VAELFLKEGKDRKKLRKKNTGNKRTKAQAGSPLRYAPKVKVEVPVLNQKGDVGCIKKVKKEGRSLYEPTRGAVAHLDGGLFF
jgi:hypothetical protein